MMILKAHIKLLLLTSVLLLGITALFAQSKPKVEDFVINWGVVDTNTDGILSQEELENATGQTTVTISLKQGAHWDLKDGSYNSDNLQFFNSFSPVSGQTLEVATSNGETTMTPRTFTTTLPRIPFAMFFELVNSGTSFKFEDIIYTSPPFLDQPKQGDTKLSGKAVAVVVAAYTSTLTVTVNEKEYTEVPIVMASDLSGNWTLTLSEPLKAGDVVKVQNTYGNKQSEETVKTAWFKVKQPAPLEVCITPPTATVCSGQSKDLTVTITGGTPSYTLTYGGNTVTLTNTAGANQTPTATYPLNTGALNATTVFNGSNVVVTDANGCTVSYTCTATVTVEECANCTILGATSVCLGATTQLTASPTTGGTWSSSNANVATVDNTGLVTGVKTGTAVISYVANGCTATATITVNAGLIGAFKVENENMEVCKLPLRTINLNNYIAYRPQSGKTVVWETKDGKAIDGTQYSTANLVTGNVEEVHYKVNEDICGSNVSGEAILFIKALTEQTLSNKTVRYCADDFVSINLNTVLKQQAVGEWEAITAGIDGNYLNGAVFQSKKAHQDGVNKQANGKATYRFRFTVKEATKCLQVGDSCIITIAVYE